MRKIQERLRTLAAKLKSKKQKMIKACFEKLEKKGYAKQDLLPAPIPSKHFPVYVGDQKFDGNLKRYDVPVACTSSIIFQALLRQFEEILVVDEGPITLSCSEKMFESVLELSLDGLKISEVHDQRS